VASLGDLMVRVGANIEGFERAMGTVGQRLRAIDRDVNRTFGGFDRIGGKLSTIGQSMSIGVTLPLLGVATAVGTMAAAFDLELRKVGSLVGGFTNTEMKNMNQAVLGVSSSLGIDAVDAAKAMYEAISAGVPKENVIDFLKVAAPAAIAGVTSTEVAVDALTSVINAYGLETSAAKGLSDQMFQAVNLGKFTFEELGTSISIATPLASSLGVSFGEVLGAATTLTSQGYSVSEAMTSVRSAMVAIISPNTDMKDLIKQTGYESGQAMITALGFQGSLEALRTTANNNVGTLTNAYGRVEALGAGLKLTGEKADQAHKDLESVKRASEGLGAATTAYNEINKSSTRQFELAVEQIKATGIELGNTLLPAIGTLLTNSKPLLEMLAGAVQWFAALPPEVQTTAIGFGAALAAIGPVTFALGTMISTISQVSAAFVSLAGISGMGSLLPALGALPGMFGKVAFAVTNGLTSALTGGEAMILRMGQAAVVAAAAFAAWHLGAWAYEQVPGVKALGDGIADMILKIPGLEAAWLKITGATGALDASQKSLETSTKNLEAALKRKGITVDGTGLSVAEYAEKLKAAAKETGLMGNAQETNQAKVEAAKKEIKKAEDQAKTYAQASKQLAGNVKTVNKEHESAKNEIKKYGDGIPGEIVDEYNRSLRAMELQVAKSKVETEQARIAGRDWDSQLDANIVSANELASKLDTLNKIQLPGMNSVMQALITTTGSYEAGLKALGITGSSELKTIAEEAAKARDAVVGSGIATDFEKQTAIYKAVKAQAEYAKVAGLEITDEQKRILAEMESDSGSKLPVIKGKWQTFGADLNGIMRDTAADIGRQLFDGDLSFGEKFKAMTSSLKDAFVATFITPITNAVADFISNTIADLLGGKGFGGVLDSLKKVGESIADIFGAGASAAGNAAGGAAGAAGSGATAAGGVASAAGGGVTAMIGAIGSIGSMISGIVGNFQFAHMNTALGRIEESTRYVKIWTGEQSQNMLWCLQTMTERSGYQTASLDAIGRFASESLAWLQRIGAATEYANELALMPAGTGGGITITMTNVTFGNRSDVDYMLSEVGRRMRERGQSF
jgi:TP901 family phage tail tape measure protein